MSAYLEAIVPDREAVRFPGQELPPVPAVVEEQEPAAVPGFDLEDRADQAGESIKALAHVGRRQVDVDLHMGGEGEHHSPFPDVAACRNTVSTTSCSTAAFRSGTSSRVRLRSTTDRGLRSPASAGP
jgi:hypothetical protein